jgi:hypothetical protein
MLGRSWRAFRRRVGPSADTTAVLVQSACSTPRAGTSSPPCHLPSEARHGPWRDGIPAVGSPLDEFVRGIGSATRFLDERLYETEVRIDGGLATVWARYDFYADSTLSHCGVDAVQLARADTAWLIIHIADTRRREGCGPH